MKKSILSVLISLLSIATSFSQDTILINVVDIPLISTQIGPSCEDGRKEAIADIAAGKFQFKSVGLPVWEGVEDRGYKVYTTKKVLLTDYNLQYINMGCELQIDISCYNKYVDSILQVKYGSNYYEKAKAKAEKLTQEAKLKSIHKGASHDMSEADLKKLLRKGISKKNAAGLSSKANIQINNDIDTQIEFDIDIKGQLQNLKFPPEMNACSALKRKLKKYLVSIPPWHPALDGYGVKQPHNTCILIKWVDRKIDKVYYCQYILGHY